MRTIGAHKWNDIDSDQECRRIRSTEWRPMHPIAKLAEAALIGARWSERQRFVFGASRKSLAITGRIVYLSQIDLDSKTPVQIVLWKDAHAVGMFSVKAVLAVMIEGLALKVIGLANI